jgi:hypothetical protein
LTVNGQPDPRVKVLNANRLGADNVTALWRQQKYTASTSNMPIASYAEGI